jgi:ribosome-associated toxin RatA of RatAB toxin-antitoxin module
MHVRKNTVIAHKAKLAMAYRIISELSYPSFMNFIPSDSPENKTYGEIEADLKAAKKSLNDAFDKIDKLQVYFREQTDTTSEVFR